jgi:membrane-bound lytic murein transglycosylase A
MKWLSLLNFEVSMYLRKIGLFLVMLIFVAGCTATIEKPTGKLVEKPGFPLVLVHPEDVPPLVDDLQWASLEDAVDRSIRYYDKVKTNVPYHLDNDKVSGREMKESLLKLNEILASSDSEEMKTNKLKETFDFYKAAGTDGKGTVLFTGYYEPVLEGSLERTEEYRYPIYRTPDDVVVVNLGKFKEKYKNEKIIGRLKKSELIPYFTREDIENKGTLAGRNIELLWVNDPIDLFFMHIQGSGKVRLSDGRFIQISYDQSNGHPNRMTNYLIDKGKLSRREMSYKSVKKYLREHPEELSDIFNYNKSYVFFRTVEEGPVGALGQTLTAGRSIATDLTLFPRGALAFIRLRKPIFDDDGNIKTWESFSRFVLNQDTGGVIKGPGHVDLFCGTGHNVEMFAGSLKEKGELYFLVKKKADNK